MLGGGDRHDERVFRLLVEANEAQWQANRERNEEVRRIESDRLQFAHECIE